VTLVNNFLDYNDWGVAYRDTEVVLVEASVAVGLARNELGGIGGWNGDDGGGERENDGDGLHGVGAVEIV
jgi:hypothetical protein